MNVYIEYVVLDNFVIDYLILLASMATLKIKYKKWRIAVSASIGTVFALVLPILNIGGVWLVLCKLALGASMVAVCANYKSTKQFGFACLWFVSYTFLLGGACIGFLFLFATDISSFVALSYSSSVPVGLIVLVVWVYLRIIFELVKYINKRKEIKDFLYNVEIIQDDVHLKICGFLDSGNHLEEDGVPIVVLQEKQFFKLFPKLKNGNLDNYGAKFISCYSVSGENFKMLVAEPERFVLLLSDGTVRLNKEVMIGLSKNNFVGGFECLLNPQLV